MPSRYRSTATLEIDSDPKEFARVAGAVLTRNTLTTMIATHNLYRGERRRMPMEDVIDDIMRKQIPVSPVAPNLLEVSFAYEDPVQAQQVSQDLVGRIITANLTLRSGLIQLVAPADQAKKQIEAERYGLAGLGLPVGLLFGVVLALILRRRATPAS